MKMNRRSFIKTSVGTAMLYGSSRAWAGANDRVRIGVIGIHGMGQNHINAVNRIR